MSKKTKATRPTEDPAIRPYREGECQVCGEEDDGDAGEFITASGEQVFAHGGCGEDFGFTPA